MVEQLSDHPVLVISSIFPAIARPIYRYLSPNLQQFSFWQKTVQVPLRPVW
ncbi:hypothetical protein [Planktothricoides raciborskii]|uniref:Uncharacterized protein n=1 Tax=Planktothricoides raciborskii FACHB-1370 TaxID=2949576 RepID=A0ABR8EP75_9CYAN|nr:hypothetical protein [Planktothricoides raciborskii]MBD2547768.1 hypothetical protein [Planktothricoides raciborskii FACHB-1370]MBD2584406.1 hypothetical protein [Planktothricoides raciborskii FACHB-1261]